MEPKSAAELDAWLREGGIVVTASDRAKRAIVSRFNRARQREGLSAWVASQVLDWPSFVRATWEKRTQNGRMLLNSLQEQALWSNIIAASGYSAALLEGPRRRLAALAMRAHELLCSYAPRCLKRSARTAWQQDPGAFSQWLTEFEDACSQQMTLSISKLPLEGIALLQADDKRRPPLLLAGFDRLLPTQKEFFGAWGDWAELLQNRATTDIRVYEARDQQSELTACARWCKLHLDDDPDRRLLVITQDATNRRGEIERTFQKHVGTSAGQTFEFTLGIPLGQIAIAQSAHLLLRWLNGSLEEQEVDWLFSSGYGVDGNESAALQAQMRGLRRRGLERTQWTLQAFLSQPLTAGSVLHQWTQRMLAAQRHLRASTQRTMGPLEWSAFVPRLLEMLGWPGNRKLSSAEFQAEHRWQQALETCGSLGFDERHMGWNQFLAELGRVLGETLFTPESQGAPILIAGPAESAGLTADAIWFLGANEDAWPARGSLHPMLPIEVQREHRMPHSTAQADWELADVITRRLLASASEVRLSYARQETDVELRVSALAVQIAGEAQPVPASFASAESPSPRTFSFSDTARLPFDKSTGTPETEQQAISSAREVRGGSTILTAQSQCAFKAFAIARLGAQGWKPAEAGLTPAARGQLLHAVLHAIWSGPPGGAHSLEELLRIADRHSFVQSHVSKVVNEKLPPLAYEQMPRRYLELEKVRLTRLVSEWLEYEAARAPFAVANTEVDTSVTIAGLTLKLRLDRVDKLHDGSLLIIDYKTGDVSPKSWELPRPDDVQLPLYAGFAVKAGEELGGLVFAKVRAGDSCFAGRVGDPVSTLGNIRNISILKKNELTLEQILEWRDAIEGLAGDFLAGRAEVDPREAPLTCKGCGLQTMCRIQERECAPVDDRDAQEAAHG